MSDYETTASVRCLIDEQAFEFEATGRWHENRRVNWHEKIDGRQLLEPNSKNVPRLTTCWQQPQICAYRMVSENHGESTAVRESQDPSNLAHGASHMPRRAVRREELPIRQSICSQDAHPTNRA